MKTYLDKFALHAGSFLVDPVDKSRYNDIKKAWYINSSKASQAALEAEVAHAHEVEATKENLDELKASVQRMNRESFEYKLSMFSNVTKILDTKKTKIKELEYANEDLQRRKRSFDEMKKEEEEEAPEQLTQALTQSYNKSQKRSSQSSASTQRTLVSRKSTVSTKTASTSTQRTSIASQRESNVVDTSQKIDNAESSRPTVKLDSSFSIPEQTQPYSSIDLTQSDEDEDPPSSLPSVTENTEKSGYLSEDYETDEDLYNPEPTI
ncbi:unnamed protein product [Mucor hiemalis]